VPLARALPSIGAVPARLHCRPEEKIIIGVGQHMPFSFLPELKGGAIRLEDFFRRVVAEVSSTLIRCSRAPEQSAMLCSADPGNRLLTMSVKLQKPNFSDLG
jgi:hypothetical protein